MAKRKRLSPAVAGFQASLDAPTPDPTMAQAPPPIARIASDASASAALAEISTELAQARSGGRLIDLLPLDTIEAGHLVRDRLEQDEDEMAALMASLTARGQQTPIEVVTLPGPTPRYGLISGWRRLSALRRLHAQTGEDRFDRIKALIIAPGSAQEAYVAMVEENEIRVNLGHYERARIAKRAVEEGVYASQRAALQGLYAAAPRAKRSKIGSFVTLVAALDDVLRFPTAISEKLGLALVKRLNETPGFAEELRQRLTEAQSSEPAQELALLQAALDDQSPAPQPRPKTKPPTRYDIASGLVLRHWEDGDKIEISGDQVDDHFLRALRTWMQSR